MKAWKDYPYWLKGGWIGIFILILYAILYALANFLYSMIYLYGNHQFTFGTKTWIFISRLVSNLDFLSLIFFKGKVTILTILPSYFIIGATIGLIVSKIKQRKNE